MVGAIGAAGPQGSNDPRDGSRLKLSPAEEPGGVRALAALEDFQEDITRLSRALGLEEGPGEQFARAVERKPIKAQASGRRGRDEDCRGTRGIAHLGTECADVKLAT